MRYILFILIVFGGCRLKDDNNLEENIRTPVEEDSTFKNTELAQEDVILNEDYIELQKTRALDAYNFFMDGTLSVNNLEELDAHIIQFSNLHTYYPDKFDLAVNKFFLDLYSHSLSHDENLFLLQRKERYYCIGLFMSAYIRNYPDDFKGLWNLEHMAEIIKTGSG